MSTSVVDARWVLEEAIVLVQTLAGPLREVGWAIALAGSVLVRGESEKDLDLILFPLSTWGATVADAKRTLTTFGFVCVHSEDAVKRAWRCQGSKDTKHVEVWADARRRRVDLFFLS